VNATLESGKQLEERLATFAIPAQLQCARELCRWQAEGLAPGRIQPYRTEAASIRLAREGVEFGVAHWANCENVASAEMFNGIAAIRRALICTVVNLAADAGEFSTVGSAKPPPPNGKGDMVAAARAAVEAGKSRCWSIASAAGLEAWDGWWTVS
jgi:hypothetical protein